MKAMHRTLLALAVVFAAPLLHSQASESAIYKQIGKLHSLSETERPKATIKIATDIKSLSLCSKDRLHGGAAARGRRCPKRSARPQPSARDLMQPDRPAGPRRRDWR